MSTPPEWRIFSPFFSQVEKLRRNWGWFLLFGIALVLLGMAAISASILTTVVSVIVLGSLLLTGGILQCIYAFWTHPWSGFLFSLLAGLLYSVVGLMFLLHPMQSAVSLTLLLAAFYIVGGIFRSIASIYLRFELWGWALLSGLIKFILGLLIMMGWPETGLWVIGLFIGIDLIFYGWFWVLLALSMRSLPKH